jgi:hypothetical protein
VTRCGTDDHDVAIGVQFFDKIPEIPHLFFFEIERVERFGGLFDLVIAMPGEQDGFQAGLDLLEFGNRHQSVHIRHLKIDDGQVDGMFHGDIDCFHAVGRRMGNEPQYGQTPGNGV